MSKSYRRFEILLPLKFNDGKPVPDKLVGKTLLELGKQSVPFPRKLKRSTEPGRISGKCTEMI